jgi:hypothetical protein
LIRGPRLPLAGKKIVGALETFLGFSNFLAAATAVPGAQWPGKAGAGGVRGLLVPILLYGGFGYEDRQF